MNMAGAAQETVAYPFTAFNFAVEINVRNVSQKVCNASFSECDGLEMTMDVKTIREGGNNGRQIRLTGPVNFGSLTLKRGMTSSFDLWNWFNAVLVDPTLRANAEVVLFSAEQAGNATSDNRAERARFVLTGCLPVKLKAPALNAKDGMVAIEELQLAYETLTIKTPSVAAG
jgi:phage tail-like protein